MTYAKWLFDLGDQNKINAQGLVLLLIFSFISHFPRPCNYLRFCIFLFYKIWEENCFRIEKSLSGQNISVNEIKKSHYGKFNFGHTITLLLFCKKSRKLQKHECYMSTLFRGHSENK